ncbi:MAG: recombinase family protein [Acidimicrobiales bacterium]
MRTALYARVSTDRQEKQRTIGSQLEALEAKAAAEGWRVALRASDDGYSGTSLDRPGLDQVRDAAAARLIDAVVVLCPDRLSRSYLHQALVLDELARFAVSVVFIEGGLADDPHGRLVAQIQSAVAEFERTKILERNRRGKLYRARQGGVVASAAGYGYRKLAAADGLPARLEIREDHAAVVRDIFDWHANEGLSIRKIAVRLIEAGVPTPKGGRLWATSTLDRLVRNPVYAGTLYYNRHTTLPPSARLARHAPGHQPVNQLRPRDEWIGVAVPPIVDADTWARSQARHHHNTRLSPRHVGADRYLLRYLVRCGECGRARSALTKKVGKRNETGYYCCTGTLPLHLREERLRCTQPSARADELDQLVWDEVTRHLLHPELILKACAAPITDQAPPPDGQLGELRAQRQRLLDAYQCCAITLTELEARRRPLEDRIGELDQSSRSTRHRNLTKADLKHRITSFAQQVADRLETMPFAERQQLLRTVLEDVVLTEQCVELNFKIPVPPATKEGRSHRSPMSDRLRSLHQARRARAIRPRRRRTVHRLRPASALGLVPHGTRTGSEGRGRSSAQRLDDEIRDASVGRRRVAYSSWLAAGPGRICSRIVPSLSRLMTSASAGGTSSSPTTR